MVDMFLWDILIACVDIYGLKYVKHSTQTWAKLIDVPIQFLELLIQQSKGCLDHFHGLISNCTEVSVNKHL